MLLIRNANIKTMAGPDLKNGCLLLENGKIAAVGQTVDALSGQLYDDERAADDVCAAGSGAGRRHAAAQGQPEGLVLRIDGVDGAQLRRQRLDDLIIIHALPAHALVVEADMAVRLHAAGRE